MSKGFKPSPQQKRIWALRDSGVLDGEAFLRCSVPGHPRPGEVAGRLARLVDTYEILRTRLDRLEGYADPLQFIGTTGEWTCREIDRSGGAATGGRPEADDPSPEAGRPGVRVYLEPDGTTTLEIGARSEMLDSRSLVLLGRYLLGASASGEGEEPLQYADVSAWLRDMLAAEDSEEARQYWGAALRSADSAFRRISLDRSKPASAGGRIARRPVQVPEDLASKAMDVAREADVSLEALLLTAWLELLRRLGQGENQSCSVAFDGVSGEELSSVLGQLTRFVPTCAPPAAQSVREALRSVQKALDAGRALQECYFPQGEGAGMPYGFEFNALPLDRSSQWRIQSLWSDVEAWRILLRAYPDAEGFKALIAYDPDALSEAAADAAAEQWLALLGAMVESDLPIRDLACSSPALTERARRHGEGPRRERPGSLLDWIEAAQEHYGDRLVDCATGSLSLADLNRCANALARDLVARGVGPGQFVGIHIGRSADFVLAALAAVKAGAAYVPLDVLAPSNRLAEMLSHLPFAAIVASADPEIASPIREFPGLVQLPKGARPQSEDAPSPQIDPASPVYVLFTSGSTGAPKPVVIPHRALLNHMAWMIETFSFDPADRFLLRTSTTFDASVWEMWAPLLVGAGMIIAGPQSDHDIHRLLHLLQEKRVSIAQFVPSLMGLLAGTGRLPDCDRLRMLFCGGEALGQGLLQSVRESTSAELVNLYGPTECCIDAAFWRPASAADRGAVAIGTPIDNTSLYVLDGEKRLAGIGITGELCIGGSGLFSGYFGLPERTSEALFPNPFGSGLLYRTGDQARLAEDGLFEFVGRLDDQVKLNGYRIELGEIDAALERLSGRPVATVVTADRQLVSFVAARDGEVDPDALRRGLEDVLPAYMIPSHIDRLESLPLRPNGKVDRTALQKLASKRQRRGVHVPPEGDVETRLAAIWSKVLGVDEVGATDSFFALGGDSIRSIQIVYEARTQGLDLSVREILRLRSIRAIALAISQRPEAGPGREAAELPAMSRMDALPADIRRRITDCYPASHMQAYVIAAYASDRDRRGIFHAQQGFSAAGTFDPGAFAEAIRHAASAFNFRTRFFDGGEGLFQVVLPDGGVEISLEQVRGPLDARFAACAEEDRRRPFDPFDLDRPLLRVAVISRSDASEHRILISNHHAVQDGWGNVEFLNGVAMRLAGTESIAFPPASNGCKELVAIEACEPPLGAAPMAELVGPAPPSDRRIGSGLSKSRIFSFPAALGTALVAAAERHGIGPKSLILAAYYSCLAEALGLRAPVVGVVANGRDARLSDPLRAMGLYWYFAPFRLPSAEDFSPANLPSVEERLLKAEASARAFWAQPGPKGDLVTEFTFNFVHFHNSSADLGGTGWRMDHRLDDFGADVALAVAFAPGGDDMLTFVLDYSPDRCGETQIQAIEQGLSRRLEEFAQGWTRPS